MTRIDDRVCRRETARKRAVRAALSVALGFSMLVGAQAAQYDYPAQVDAQRQYQAAQRQATQSRSNGASSSRTPILSGLFNNQGGSAQEESVEPQRVGLLGGKPLLPSLRGSFEPKPQTNAQSTPRAAQQPSSRAMPPYAAQRNPAQSRPGVDPNQAFHSRAQHLGVTTGIAAESRPANPSGAAILSQASANPQDANEALSKLPWDLFPAETRERLEKLATRPTMYRRLPMAGCRCNPELFDFFLTYPQTIVELWRSMGYEEITMAEIGRGQYTISEKGGSKGTLTILYQTSELAVAHVTGVYRGAGLIRPVEGEALVVLQTRYTEDASLTPLVICRLDAFIDIKNPGVDLLARTFTQALGKIADSNFQQTLAFIDSVSQTAEQDPQQFAGVVAQLRGLPTDARRALLYKTQQLDMQKRLRMRGELPNYMLLAKANDPNPGYARILSRGANQVAPHSSGIDASYASSAATPSTNRARSSAKSYEISAEDFMGNDFSLADDESYDGGDWSDDEHIMTGDAYLATQSLGRSSSAPSLAKLKSIPSTNSRAMALLSESEEENELGVDSLLTTDEPAEIEPLAVSSDDEDFDVLAADESLAIAIPLEIAGGASESEEVAEITIDDDGVPILDFNVDDNNVAEDEDEDDASTIVALPDSLEETDESDNESDALILDEIPDATETLLSTADDGGEEDGGDEESNTENDADSTDDEADEFLPVLSEEDEEESQISQSVESFSAPRETPAFKSVKSDDKKTAKADANGWTVSNLSSGSLNAIKSVPPTPAASDQKEAPKVASRPVTLRYTPPVDASNQGSPVKTFAQINKADDGERVATYRWTPVPGVFVAKTAAVETTDSGDSKVEKR